MFIVYDLLNFLFCILYFPYLVLKRKWHVQFVTRFGQSIPSLCAELAKSQNIWIHAVSVGEVLAVSKMIQRLKKEFPSYRIVISVVTQTGYQIAHSTFRGGETIVYAPLDFSFVVNKFISAINPRLYLTAETEIWPNLFTALHKAKVPIIQINGRISDNSFKGYKLIRFLTGKILKLVSAFCVQTQKDADRLVFLGASSDHVKVIGNIKFDDHPGQSKFALSDLKLTDKELLWVAGSTHPGEENNIIDIYKTLVEEFSDLRLVLAPRHPERTNEVNRLVAHKGFVAVKFSEMPKNSFSKDQIVIVDTMGHLKSLYSLASFVFVGKSLAVGGGHNIIEPAYFAKPILVGPMTYNFRDIVRIFLDKNAVIQVNDKEDLLVQMRTLLRNPQQIEKLGSAAREVVMANRGAMEKTVAFISDFLPKDDS